MGMGYTIMGGEVVPVSVCAAAVSARQRNTTYEQNITYKGWG
jgi:hypothetical protein